MDVDAATTFLATHARLLERHRLRHLLGEAPAEPVLTALDAYRNPDGGYGWALEPDCRSTTSQPVAAMHALQILADIQDTTSDRPIRLLDWLAERSFPDGGTPFGLPFADTAGSAKHWITADPSASSLQMTTQLAAHAHRLARHRPDVADHPWLSAATAYCLSAIAELPDTPHAYEVMFAVHFLDAAAHPIPENLSTHIVLDGPTPVTGGAEGESVHLLDFSPYPDTPSRALFPPSAVTTDRTRLTEAQQSDGGWTVDYPVYSELAPLEWRGVATVQAVSILSA